MVRIFTLRLLLGVLGAILAGRPALAQPGDVQRRLIHEQTGGKRLALVVGNDEYRNVRKLENAVNDARDMGQILAKLGFEVDVRTNADFRTIGEAVDQFVSRVSPGDVALFHYSGHGVQLDGQNYLIPVDFVLKDRADVRYSAYSASRVHDRMVGAASRLNIVILDACRDSGFWPSRGAESGLAPMNAAEGSFIAFATAPGRTASDGGSGTNGLFTGELLAVLRQPGLKLDEIFNEVRAKVYQASGKKQLPWTSSSMIGDFYFQPPAPVVAAVPPDTGLQIELAYWNSIQNCTDTGCFDGYLNRFGESGQFSELARIRRNQLLQKGIVSPPAGPSQATAANPAATRGEVRVGISEPAGNARTQPPPQAAGIVKAVSPQPQADSSTQTAKPEAPNPLAVAMVRRQEMPPKETDPGQELGELPRLKQTPPDAPQAEAGAARVNSSDGLSYRWIPPGNFQMGCSPGDNDCSDDEKPAHEVTISRGYWLGESEVTVEAYKRYAAAMGVGMPPPTTLNTGWRQDLQPVVNVTWNEASEYCRWAGGRLPDEAEWEHAARAGVPAARYGDVKEIAWFDGNSRNRVRSVGEKQANAWGLYDILGNVWEWTADRYDESRYAAKPETDPPASGGGRLRVLRGGSWNDKADHVRASHRYGYMPGFRSGSGGFRGAIDALPTAGE